MTMTGSRPRRRRRRRKARQGSTATHISSLGEDLVLEIFLRLPSLATLVRAALTCRAWRRAVASSPDFWRRFRALHPAPPLLGVFFNGIDICDPPPRVCVPSFVPGGFRDWDLAGPVRGGDFFLTSLLERSNKSSCPYWKMLDCRGGRVLLTDMYDEDKPLIVLNPLMRRSARVPIPDPAYQHESETELLHPRLICLDDDPPSSFRVVLLAYGSCSCTLRASVFSSETGEWSAVPLVDVPARSEDASDAIDHSFDEADRAEEDGSDAIWIDDEWKMQAKGSIYWIYKWRGHRRDGSYLISLDTITMEFSFAKLPQCLRSPDWRFTLDAGGTEDGAACIVYSDGYSNVGVVKHTRGDDGVERWVLDRVHRLELDGELQGINLGEFSGLAVFF